MKYMSLYILLLLSFGASASINKADKRLIAHCALGAIFLTIADEFALRVVRRIPCNHTAYDSSDRFPTKLCSVSIDTIAKVLCRSVVFRGLGAWGRATERDALSRVTGFASQATYVPRFLLAAMGAMTLGCAMSFGADYLPKKYEGSSLQRTVVRAMPPSLQKIKPSCTTMCKLIGYPLSIWFSSCLFMDWQP